MARERAMLPVRMAALAVLEERPMSVSDVLKTIVRRTKGELVPAGAQIGTVLLGMSDDGLAESDESEGFAKYTITAEGKQEKEKLKSVLKDLGI